MISALAITGPTASGKTSLSLRVAEILGCEILCLDSMQIYKHMNIGTAKATEAERAVCPHHMLDFLEPRENYSVEQYRHDSLICAGKICERGRIPLFVGGTGLYLDALIRGFSPDSPPSDERVRRELMSLAEQDGGVDRLWDMLNSVDRESAEKIHKNNVRRVVRALEIYTISGKTKTYFDKKSKELAKDIDLLTFTLDFHNRENLYSRVDTRVDIMLGEGLVEETKWLYERNMLREGSTCSQAIGYKEILPYVKGEAELGQCVEQLKLSSRRYAKRQLTWFRHEADAIRIFLDGDDGKMRSSEDVVSEILSHARKYIEKSEER